MSAPKVDVLAVMDPSHTMVRSLDSAGWQLLSVDIDLCSETARIELRQEDLYVTFDARGGKASITREVMEKERIRVGRKGDISVTTRIAPRFIGRHSGLGLRSGLRFLSHYVADNAAIALSHKEARDIFRPLLSGAALARIGSAS